MGAVGVALSLRAPLTRAGSRLATTHGASRSAAEALAATGGTEAARAVNQAALQTRHPLRRRLRRLAGHASERAISLRYASGRPRARRIGRAADAVRAALGSRTQPRDGLRNAKFAHTFAQGVGVEPWLMALRKAGRRGQLRLPNAIDGMGYRPDGPFSACCCEETPLLPHATSPAAQGGDRARCR
jgi:hypothetical protein